MNESEYVAIRNAVIRAGQLCAQIPLDRVDELLAAGNYAQAVAPIVDPTLARDAGVNLADELKLFRAFRAFRAELETFR